MADIYRYKALFKGNTPVAAKQKEVKKGYKDTDRSLAIDLYLAPVVTPTIGRNLLGDKWYDIFVAGRNPGEMSIVIATLGRYPLDGESYISSGDFKRLAITQNQVRYPLSKDYFRNLGFLHGEDPLSTMNALNQIGAGITVDESGLIYLHKRKQIFDNCEHRIPTEGSSLGLQFIKKYFN